MLIIMRRILLLMLIVLLLSRIKGDGPTRLYLYGVGEKENGEWGGILCYDERRIGNGK